MNNTGYLKAGDVISGQSAWAKALIRQDNGTTTVEDLFMAKNLTATVTINQTAVRTLNFTGDQHKPSGWTGEGSMTLYTVTTLFRKMVLQYMKTRKPVIFDLIVMNEDNGSTIGKQTVMLKTCQLRSLDFAKFDVDTDTLDEAVSFTFDDADILDEFGKPILGN